MRDISSKSDGISNGSCFSKHPIEFLKTDLELKSALTQTENVL